MLFRSHLVSVFLVGLIAFALSPKPAFAAELVPGIDACLKRAEDLGNPDSPNFAGMGEARDARYDCFQKALDITDRELQAAVQQAKKACHRKDTDNGFEGADCRHRYDMFLETARSYRQAAKVMLEMYWAGCPTCNYSDTVEFAAKETRRLTRMVKRAAKNYTDDIK